ncbi:NYN domain-containing protein [Diaminobutyricibacter sp. McL0618]|uniref:NYN domain-containing protein n=1 Tax=Leifsonia sp. McL0618 TaxID=3415677 RepID=UPI003CECBA9E
MAEPGDGRVAVYIDFDNIILSRYDQVNGRNAFQRDKAKIAAGRNADPDVAERLARATVDLGAVIDFASSFGTLVLTRAYADWSTPMNAEYRGQLVGRAVDLVQLFPAAAYAKNGADIRLAVDAVEDLFRLPDLTHVVIVAGDSDYIALAQRCKRLGRYVVGVGMAGSTSKTLAAACDEFVNYDDLPGVVPLKREAAKAAEPAAAPAAAAPAKGRGGAKKAAGAASEPAEAASGSAESGAGSASGAAETVAASVEPVAEPAAAAPARSRRRARLGGPAETVESVELEPEVEEPAEDPQAVASRLLERALRLGHEKDDADWLHSSSVKTQMKRMDPSFSEKTLGFRSFSDFVKSRPDIAELDESSTTRLMRLAADRADA